MDSVSGDGYAPSSSARNCRQRSYTRSPSARLPPAAWAFIRRRYPLSAVRLELDDVLRQLHRLGVVSPPPGLHRPGAPAPAFGGLRALAVASRPTPLRLPAGTGCRRSPLARDFGYRSGVILDRAAGLYDVDVAVVRQIEAVTAECARERLRAVDAALLEQCAELADDHGRAPSPRSLVARRPKAPRRARRAGSGRPAWVARHAKTSRPWRPGNRSSWTTVSLAVIETRPVSDTKTTPVRASPFLCQALACI